MISVLIPAYNEAQRIGATIAAARTLSQNSEVVVVDDGSSDATARIAEEAGADKVLRRPNGGKGAALQTGFAACQGEIFLLLDADLGETAHEATKLLAPVLTDRADMTIATFPILQNRGGGVGLVVRLARWGIRRLTGQTMLAPLSGQRAIRRTVIEQAGGFAQGWGVEVALTVAALQNGFQVLEVPTTMTHRVTGRSPAAIWHRAEQFTAVALILIKLWIRPGSRVQGVQEADKGD